MGLKIKITIYFFLIFAGIFSGASFAHADYFLEGTAVSTNLLSGKSDVAQVTVFKAATTIPAGTTLSVQFSEDGTNWKNTSLVKGGWDSLTDGENTIDVKILGFNTANFYYHAMLATTDPAVTPALLQIEVDYSDVYTVSGPYYDQGTVLSSNLLSGISPVSVTFFAYNISSLPTGTAVQAQFSTDGTNWYDSSGTKDAKDTLTLGDHTAESDALSLSDLGWSNAASFYYKLYLSTDNFAKSPAISSAGVIVYSATSVKYDFEEGYGDTVHSSAPADESASGTFDPGTGGSNTTVAQMWDKNGKFGGAADFDGTDDLLKTSAFQPTDAEHFSVSQFVNFSSLKTSAPIFSQWGNSENNFLLKEDDADPDELKVCVASSLTDDCTNYAVTTDANLATGTWYGIQAVYDGTGADNVARLKIYINGTDKTLSFSGTIPATLQNPASDLEIGGDGDMGNYFQGKIDSIESFNSALSDDDVKILQNGGVVINVSDKEGNNNGNAMNGAASRYCVPGDTSKCDAPVAEWKMDEGSGATLHDTSGNGNDGTLANGPAWTKGKFGKALDFDGTNDYVDAGDLFYSDKFSVCAWVNEDSLKSVANIVIKRNSSGVTFGSIEWSMYLLNGKLGFSSSVNDSTIDLILQSNTVINAGEWHHVCAVQGGNGSYGRIYIDGIEEASAIQSGIMQNSTSRIQVGVRSSNDDSRYFNGMIDDVKIYNYARTASQIAYDYNQGAPIASYDFNEGHGGTAHDSSGNGYNGTLAAGSTGANTTTTAMWDKNGKTGGAIEFDGADDVVNIPGDLYENTNALSVSVWFNMKSAPAEGLYTDLATKGSIFATALYASGGHAYIHCNYGNGSLWLGGFGGTTAIQTGKWYHAVYVLDGSSSRVYLDGKLEATGSGGTTGTTATTINLGYSSNAHFNGLMDDLKIYNYALSGYQVKEAYNAGQMMTIGSSVSENNNGTTVTGSAKEYCVPGDISKCDKPVGEWKFDTGSGTTAYDTSGNGNNGTLINGPTWAQGKTGKALSLDGMNDYVNAGTDSSLDIKNSITLEAWIKSDTLAQSNNPEIISKGGSAAYYRMRFYDSGYMSFKTYGLTNETLGSSLNISVNSWNHVAMVYDGSYKRIYINGILNASVGATGSMTGNAGEILNIGGIAGVENFKGLIDDVRIYNYARTASQIAWDYNHGGPMAEWRFNETSGATAHDDISNTYSGTLNGMTDSNWVSGKIGNSLSFNGSSQYVGISDVISNINTVSLWIKPSSATQSIVDFDGGTHKISISSGAVTATGFDSYYVDGVLNGTVADTNWHHITAITNSAFSTTSGFTIGKISSAYYSGLIDDVKFFGYPLTAQQIKNDYSNGAVSFGQ